MYGGILHAPNSILRIGDMIHARVIVNSVGVSWQKPYRNNTYLVAEVTLDLTEVVDQPYSAADIWSKGGFI